MSAQFGLIISIAFFCLYVLFRWAGINKMKQELSGVRSFPIHERYLRLNNNFTLFCAFANTLIFTVVSFSPNESPLLVPFHFLRSELISLFGVLLIKVGFIWLILAGIISSNKRILTFRPNNTRRIRHFELLFQFALIIYSTGVMFYIPSFASLWIASVSLSSYLISGKKFRELTINLNRIDEV